MTYKRLRLSEDENEMDIIQVSTLPTEIVLAIVNIAAGEHPWELSQFLLISKSVYTDLIHRRQQVHIYTQRQFDKLVDDKWPSCKGISFIGDDRQVIGQISKNAKSTMEKSLYLHYLEHVYDGISQRTGLQRRLEAIDMNDNEGQISTLGIRLTGYCDDFDSTKVAIGLWTCNALKGLKNLFADLSTKRPLNQEVGIEERIYPYQSPVDNQEDQPIETTESDEDETMKKTSDNAVSKSGGDSESLGLESFALALPNATLPWAVDCTVELTWDDFDVSFLNLRRIYLFWYTGSSTHLYYDGKSVKRLIDGRFDQLLNSASALEHIELLVCVIVQEWDAREWVAEEAPAEVTRTGCVQIGPIIVIEAMHGNQDALGLMHRVIDDVNKEWAPTACRGPQWAPDTRPRYILAPPSDIFCRSPALEPPRALRTSSATHLRYL